MWKFFLAALGVVAVAGAALCSPVRSDLGGNNAMQSGNDWQDVVPFIRITPTTTATHYSPFNTGVTFSAEDDWRIEAVFRHHGEPIGTWGQVFGNVARYNSNGIQIRHYDGTKRFSIYMPLENKNDGRTAGNTQTFPQTDGFAKLVIDTAFEYPQFIRYGEYGAAWPGFGYNRNGWEVESVPLYIGEGPRGGGATIGTDWARVTIWKNGECVRDYVPHWSGGFLDLVSDSLLAKDARSSTAVEYREEAGSLELEVEEEVE